MLQRLMQVIQYSHKSSGRSLNWNWIRSAQSKATQISKPKQSSKAKQAETILDSLYSAEERRNILDCFNNAPPQVLAMVKLLNQQKAAAIENYRVENGDFRYISEVLNVPTIGIQSLQTICGIMKMYDHTSLHEVRIKISNEIVRCHPHLTNKECPNIESLITVDLQPDRVSWLKMNRNLEVEDWKQHILFDKPIQRFDHVQFMQQLDKFVTTLPSTSIYCMEHKLYRVPNQQVSSLIVNLRCLQSMLITMLDQDYSLTKKQRVHLIKPSIVSRHHELSIGGERVSGQHIVRDMIQDQHSRPDVVIPKPLSDSYLSHDRIQQDKLSDCLLQAITFWKLLILKTDKRADI